MEGSKRLRDWKTLEYQQIRQMWRERCDGGIHAMAICNKCGGSSISTCECSYERWVGQLTLKEFEEWQDQKQNKLIEEGWEKPFIPYCSTTTVVVQKFCTQCGSSIIDKFCGSCGVKIK